MANNAAGKNTFSNGWEVVGPFNIDNSPGNYSPGLGRLECFYVDPNNADLMYLGTRSGGFWKTTDGGSTWTGGSTDFLPASGVRTMTVSPTNPNRILISVSNSINRTSHGVYMSNDGGETWNNLAFSSSHISWPNGVKINKIAYHPTIPNLVFALTSRGVYRSTDNFSTWNLIAFGSTSTIAFHPTNAGIVYYYRAGNVYRSTDQGANFVAVDLPGNIASEFWPKLDVSDDCPNCAFIAVGSQIFKSTNSGVSFIEISNSAPSPMGFAVSDDNQLNIISGYVDAMASSNGGVSFTQKTWWSLGDANHGAGTFTQKYNNSEHYIHADLRSAEYINGVFYVTTDGAFAKSEDDGETWEMLSRGLSIRENYALGVSQ